MYGKIFSSLFTGSMYGAGSCKFALMAYVIANMRPDKEVGFQVELNVLDLANRIGESPEAIQAGITYLCSPDPNSRSGGEDGRRLVKVGAFDYRVVNGTTYAALRSEEERREKNRVRQERFRSNKPRKSKIRPLGGALLGESAGVRAYEQGGEEAMDVVVTANLPSALR